jgi:ATP-binding protein involved in chromosome partitioning
LYQTKYKEKEMKIAIPTANGQLCPHFGHCEQFAIVEVDKEQKEIINTTMLTPPHHEPGILPRWLHEQGADMIIAGGMGQRAQGLFAQNQIQVVVGVTQGTPEIIIKDFLGGNLQTGNNLCDH